MIRKTLTIAGSDSSGGAGIQADLKTFSALKTYGMSVITAVTAQNTRGISGIMEVSEAFVAAQMDAVLSDLPPEAAKTGMLCSPGIAETVSAKAREYRIRNLVVDPVLFSTSGAVLLNREGMEVMRRSLFPLAVLVTPNTEEAAFLTGREVQSADQAADAARAIYQMGAPAVLVKGGHLAGDAVDVFFDGQQITHIRQERIATRDSHGTGCVLSAAITAYLAWGNPVLDAVRLAKTFITGAIQSGLRIGEGQGPCDPLGLLRGPSG